MDRIAYFSTCDFSMLEHYDYVWGSLTPTPLDGCAGLNNLSVLHSSLTDPERDSVGENTTHARWGNDAGIITRGCRPFSRARQL